MTTPNPEFEQYIVGLLLCMRSKLNDVWTRSTTPEPTAEVMAVLDDLGLSARGLEVAREGLTALHPHKALFVNTATAIMAMYPSFPCPPDGEARAIVAALRLLDTAVDSGVPLSR
jgi:hypothetical protein